MINTIKLAIATLVMILMISNAAALEVNLTDIEKEKERPMPEMKLEKINSSAALLTIANPTERLVIAPVKIQIWSSEFSIINGTRIHIKAGETYEEIYTVKTRVSTINIEAEIFQYLHEDFTIVPTSPQEDKVTLISYKKLLIETIIDYESLLIIGFVGSLLILLFFISRQKKQSDDQQKK